MESSLRQKLTAAEEARLQAHFDRDPRARQVWEEEVNLNRLLQQLPDAPLASHFTAQVLKALDRDGPLRLPTPSVVRWLRRIRPAYRVAWACSLVAVAVLGWHQYHAFARARMAASLASIAGGVESAANVAQLPSVDFWQDFDSISRLPLSRGGHAETGADEELLAALR